MVSTNGSEQEHKRRSTRTSDPVQAPQEPCKRHEEPSPRLSQGDRSAALQLLRTLTSDPHGQAEIHTFFKELEKGHASLAREGRTIIRIVIAATNEAATGDFQQLIHQLTAQTSEHAPKQRATVSTQNLGPLGIWLSMDVVEDTLASGIARHETDDVPKKNYSGWGSSGMAWIKAVTITGQKVDIVNVYQHTSNYPQKQQRLQAALTRALNTITDRCMLFGDFYASIQGGRLNYAPAHANNPTTIALL